MPPGTAEARASSHVVTIHVSNLKWRFALFVVCCGLLIVAQIAEFSPKRYAHAAHFRAN
jgi:hypothetical protein